MRRLFVSPHPDDAEIGCGGFIHRLMSEGAVDVTIAVCMGHGDLVSRGGGHIVRYTDRVREQEKAAAVLGGPKLAWLNIAPSSRFDLAPRVDFVNAFDKLFSEFTEVYIPLPSSHNDHQVVWSAARSAFRPGVLDTVNLYAYEQPGPGHMCHQSQGLFVGRRYIPLSKRDVDAKCDAFACHQSQVDHCLESITGVAGLQLTAKMRGLEVGLDFAEVVYPIREIWSPR